MPAPVGHAIGRGRGGHEPYDEAPLRDHQKRDEHASAVYQAGSISTRNGSIYSQGTSSQWPSSQHSFRFQSSPSQSLSASAPSLSALDDRQSVKIAIICALPPEADAVLAAFGRRRDDRRSFGKASGDQNAYTICFLDHHPIVVAHMPGAGKALAAKVAANLGKSFRHIQLVLVVGICGGVPGDSSSPDIRLGDVVVSKSIVQYDYGSKYSGDFERKPAEGNTSLELRTALSQLETDVHRTLLEERTCSLLGDHKVGRRTATYPGINSDRLFDPSYLHKHRNTHCDICRNRDSLSVCPAARKSSCAKLGCEEAHSVFRPAPVLAFDGTNRPSIHIGAIGSGDWVMKSGKHRDSIAQDAGVIAFEMEGAGLIGDYPCLVIKGVADYADSHKNDVWHHYASATAACCTRAFLEIYLRDQFEDHQLQDLASFTPRGSPAPWTSSQESESLAFYGLRPRSPIWSVKVRPEPYRANLVGRQRELDALDAMYSEPGCSRISLFGLGGVGKSKLALEFASYLKDKLPDVSIFWVQAADALTFNSDYAEIGRLLQVSPMAELQTDMKHLVKRHLAQEQFGSWLLIIDNIDNYELFFGEPGNPHKEALNNFVPKSSRGCTLVTTCDRKLALNFSRRHTLDINCLDQQSGASLMGSLLTTPLSTRDATLLPSLLERLTYLPLAIVQAASYITECGITLSDYLSLLDDTEENVFELLNEDFKDEGLSPEAKNSIISTWRITFEDIARRSNLASQYLRLIACIDSKNIPETFLPEGPSRKQKIDAIALLTGYSFLTRREPNSERSKVLDMHNLVHLACRGWLRGNSELQISESSALKQLLEVFPIPVYANRPDWSLYLPHASRLLKSCHISHMDNRFELDLRVGKCFLLEGRYRDATTNFKRVVEYRDKTLHARHPKLLEAYTDLAEALKQGNHLTEALKYSQEALRGYTEINRVDEPVVVNAFANVASIKRRQYWRKEAQELEERVIEVMKKVFGEHHPDTLKSMANLAATYKSHGSNDRAEKLLRQVLAGQRDALGEDDPAFLETQIRLASIYREAGRLDEAEKLAIEVKDQRQRILGAHHPDTWKSMATLASTYRQQKRLQEAEKLERKVLRLRISLLGHEDPDTMKAMGNLAATYRSQGKYIKSEALDQRALALKTKVFGETDHSTLTTMSSIASTYRKSNRVSEADALTKKVLKLCQRAFGESNRQTLGFMADVAKIFRREGSRGSLKAAVSLAKRIVKERERTLGANNKLTRDSKRFLETVQRQRNKQRARREGSEQLA